MDDQRSRMDMAKAMGFEYTDVADDDLFLAVDQVYQGRDSLRFRNVMVKDGEHARFALGELSWISSASKSNHRRAYKQTTVLVEADDCQLPGMVIEPATLMTGITGRLTSLLGVKRVSSGHCREFDKRFRAVSIVPQAVRPLLTPELTAFFLAHPEVTVAAQGNCLGVAYKHRTIGSAQARKLLQVAAKLARLLIHVERKTRGQRPTEKEAVHENHAHGPSRVTTLAMGGPAIARSVHDDFLNQPAPRTIPAEIRSVQLGSSSFLVMIGGAIISLAGTVMALFWPSTSRIELLILGGILLLVGSTAFGLAKRFRAVRLRILRSGAVACATVTKVERTEVTVNNLRRYKVTFVVPWNGSERQVRSNQYGSAVQKARQLQRDQGSTRLLVDDINSNRILWLEPDVG